MYYIFLDIDGVLNTENDWKRPFPLNKKCIKRCNFKITADLTGNAFCCMKHYNYFKEKTESLGLNLTPSKKGTKNKLINTIKNIVKR